ncbi:MAG: alpha/beta hydrolase [Neomegalonema sp.]|nr:alpha/beta hydrolase [Neomegalonema sp.]
MAYFKISDADHVLYEHAAPSRAGAPTFVFVNALTGSLRSWEAVVAPALRSKGFGSLSYNFRGQDGSDFAPEQELTPRLIVDDLVALMGEVAPQKPVFVGLSIGGLFAAQAHLAGAPAAGLVFLNTLREIGPRIAWVNDAMPQIVAAGGVSLFLDALFPLLVNQEFAAAQRSNFLKGGYAPLDPAHGHANLMRHAASADWDLPYERLALPVLSITGLQDRVFLDLDVVERLSARIPSLRREEWANAGHLLPAERPEQLVESLARFGAEIEEGAA